MSLSTQWDPLFAKYAGHLPVAFLRALSERESGMNPNETGGSFWGILQVGISNVLPGFNASHGTHYTAQDLLNPEVNIQIAADLLNRIVAVFEKHPDPNMKPNWMNPEFVKLVLAGWNSGYSEGGGVGKVARYLESQRIPVTHDNVFQYARAAGATQYLSDTAKQRWQRGVADLYFQQPDAGQTQGLPLSLKISLAIGIGLVLARYVFK